MNANAPATIVRSRRDPRDIEIVLRFDPSAPLARTEIEVEAEDHHGDGQGPDRDVDVEDPAPGEAVDEESAEEGPGDRGHPETPWVPNTFVLGDSLLGWTAKPRNWRGNSSLSRSLRCPDAQPSLASVLAVLGYTTLGYNLNCNRTHILRTLHPQSVAAALMD